MDKFIYHLVSHPFIVGLLIVCFTLSMIAYYARVHRESKPDYKRPEKASAGE
jgi:hypothetical protein